MADRYLAFGRWLIYGLVDPRTKLVRYIGRSSDGTRRPLRHLYQMRHGERSYKANWIMGLESAGLRYEVAILEVMNSEAMLSSAERWWIAYGRACGWPLTNLTDGGDGNSGHVWSAESIAKRQATIEAGGQAARDKKSAAISARLMGNKHSVGRIHSESSIRKMIDSQRSRFASSPHSQSTRDKISASKRGKITWTEAPRLEAAKRMMGNTFGTMLRGVPKSWAHVERQKVVQRRRVGAALIRINLLGGPCK